SELEPAHEELAELGVAEIAAGDESPDICGPVRQTGYREVETSGNLALETRPVGEHVAGPSSDGIALCSRERRSRKDKDPLPVAGAALAFVHGLSGHQRKDVGITVAAADVQLVAKQNVFFLAFGFRLGRVEPPGIDADPEKVFVH